jgi:hypothetical protein
MSKRLVALTAAAALLAFSAVPSFADHHTSGHGGGNGGWHGSGGGWGVGPAIGLGVGLGLLGGALATAPYYSGYDNGYGYAPYAGTPASTVWYWCDPYLGYYPAVPQCPVPWQPVFQ